MNDLLRDLESYVCGCGDMLPDDLRERIRAALGDDLYDYPDGADPTPDELSAIKARAEAMKGTAPTSTAEELNVKLTSECLEFRDKSYIWADKRAVALIQSALTQAREDAEKPLKAEILRLRGGEQETFSDQKRERLFKGTGLDYIRHRAEKHEREYNNKAQAQHLRRLATDIEDSITQAREWGRREAADAFCAACQSDGWVCDQGADRDKCRDRAAILGRRG